jgi:hypothetical protein
VSRRDLDRQTAVYTELHEGAPPQRVVRQRITTPRGVRPLGRIYEIQYRKRTPDGMLTYWHPYAEHAQPLLGKTSSGDYVIYAGRYTTTTHGIEDLPKRGNYFSGKTVDKTVGGEYHRSREQVPGRPEWLVDLGNLEWIRYRTSVGKKQVSFSQHKPQVLAHDQRGDLHIVRGHSTNAVPSAGENQMYQNPRHRRRRHRNPMDHVVEGGGKALADVGVVALGVMVTANVLGFAEKQFAPNTSLTTLGLTNIALGLAGAALIGATTDHPRVAIGVGLGGFVSGATLCAFDILNANLNNAFGGAPGVPLTFAELNGTPAPQTVMGTAASINSGVIAPQTPTPTPASTPTPAPAPASSSGVVRAGAARQPILPMFATLFLGIPAPARHR